jgi:hypothetical protein
VSEANRPASFDWRAVAWGAPPTAAIMFGVGEIFVSSHSNGDAGPTAQIFGDVAACIMGGGVGLIVGSAAAAVYARGPAFPCALLSGLAGWLLALVAALFGVGEGATAGDVVFSALLLFVPAVIAVGIGAYLGSFLRPGLRPRES